MLRTRVVGRSSAGLLLMAGSLLLSTRALAETVISPAGPIDSSCVHAIPKGGKVDADTGNIVLNGNVVDHMSCHMSWSPRLPAQLGEVGSGQPDNWYEQSLSQATTISGYTGFNGMDVTFTVPPIPTSTSTTYLDFIFPALVNLSGGAPFAIIQPIISIGKNCCGGRVGQWTMQAMEAWPNNGLGYSPAEPVNPGDQLHGFIYQVDGPPDTPEWQIYIEDNTTGGWSYNDLWPSPSWSNFTYAYMGALEAYDNAASNGPNYYLTSCNELPGSNSANFLLGGADGSGGLYEGGPYWYDQNQVNSATWTARQDGLPPTKCNFRAYELSSPPFTELDWVSTN